MDKKFKIEIPKDEINRDFWAHEVNIHVIHLSERRVKAKLWQKAW